MKKRFISFCLGIVCFFNISLVLQCYQDKFEHGMLSDDGDDIVVSDENILISSIEFEGNQLLKRQTLLELLRIEPGEIFQKERLKTGLKNILTEYQKLSRFFVTIQPIIQKIHSNQIVIIIKINEDKSIKVGDIRFKGNSLFSNSELFNVLGLQKGNLFDYSFFGQRVNRILSLYSENGYPHAEIIPMDFNIDEDGEIDFTLQINENELVEISDVKITGLKKTKPNVILREIPIHPDMQFCQSKIDESFRILKNSGYFYEVESDLLEPGNSPSEIVFNAKVTEARTGRLNGVIGYDASEDSDKMQKWTGMFELSDTNLFGTGRKLNLLWKSGVLEIYRFGYEEPWLFNNPINVGFEISGVNQTDRFTKLISKERAVSFSIGTHLRRKYEGTFTLTYKKIDLPEKIYETMQSGSKYAAKLSFQRDTRDYILNPTKGRLDYLAVEISQGDFRLKKFWLGLNQYFRTLEKQVIAISLNGALCLGNDIPPTELFYLGGANTLRGYSENWFRGPKRVYSNFEYRFLVGRTSQVFLFTDFGSISSIDEPNEFGRLKIGYGFGVRLESRSGILRIDYGLAQGDSPLEGKIHLNLGLVR